MTSTDKLAQLEQVESMVIQAKTTWENDLSRSVEYFQLLEQSQSNCKVDWGN